MMSMQAQVPRRSRPDGPSREAKEIKELKLRKRIKEEKILLREALGRAPISKVKLAVSATYGGTAPAPVLPLELKEKVK